ncbi:hypothetical protein BH23GEM9_BH23GEM9_17070 [soil metagenome]
MSARTERGTSARTERGMSARTERGTCARSVFISATLEWLHRRLLPPDVRIDADTQLFEEGVIDSMGILRLIAWTEHAGGCVIADEHIRMDNFHSVRRIAETFIADEVHDGGGLHVDG